MGRGVGLGVYRVRPTDGQGRTTLRVPARGAFDLMAYANPSFDPSADFFSSQFLDENGEADLDMQVEALGLVAGTEEIVLTIPGLP